MFFLHLLYLISWGAQRWALLLFGAMQDYAKHFYSSKQWANCRQAYKKSVGGLCEHCLMQGVYTPGEIVHHKIHITPDNIDNPLVVLNWDNLELLCRQCHGLAHGGKRYKIDKDGKVIPR